jgi:large subunit ribosomal protein L10
MSKPIKNLITDVYKHKFADVSGAVIVDIRGISSNDNNSLRATLAEQGIRVTVVKNSLARRAMEGTSLAGMSDLFEGACALVYGGESVVNVARTLIDQAKAHKFEFRGAFMEGVAFGPDEIEALSKYPTREEAQAQVIQVVLGPGSQVAGALVGIGNEIAGILKTLEEKLEKGETVSKVA